MMTIMVIMKNKVFQAYQAWKKDNKTKNKTKCLFHYANLKLLFNIN